jgi:protein TonB
MRPVILLLAMTCAVLGCSSEEPQQAADTATGDAPAVDAVDVNEAFDTAPEAITMVEPEYPDEARREGVSGKTAVEVEVSATGTVDAARVLESSGDERLDKAAVEAVRKWTFRPALKDGEAVPAKVVVPVQFALS